MVEAAESRKGRALRVLVAEDDQVFGRMLVDSFLRGRFLSTVTHCLDGDQALAHLRKALAGGQPPDVFVLDVLLPGTDGVEVALTLRQEEQTAGARPVPIIFLTAVSATDARLQQAIQFCQPARHVHKGACEDGEELAERIQELMGELIQSRT